MPNRPTHPRIALPPALAARCDALRAQAPTGRPSRQAVVERALALGLDALEAGPDADEATVPGMAREVVYGSGTDGDGGPSLKTILFGHEPTPVERARALLAEMVDRLPCLPEREDLEALQEALGVPDAPKPAPSPADAPTGSPAPALARRVARGARAAGFDASARAGVVTVTAPGHAGHTPDGQPPDAVTIAPRVERGERVSAEPGKPFTVYLTTPETAPWGVEVGQATVTGLDVPAPTAEDEAAAEAVNRGRPDGRVRTRAVG